MNTQKFIKDYKKWLKENADPVRAKNEKAYLYSDLKHYGVSVWERRKYFKAFEPQLKKLNKKQALELVKLFWQCKYFEERGRAIGILNLHKDKLNLTDMALIEKLMRESKGWAFLDSLIIPLMPIIIEKDKKAYRFIKKWIEDKDFWVRRSALLSQLLFFREGKDGNKKLFFDMAKSQFDESWIDEVYEDKVQNKRAKFFIRKAIGWTLREMSHKNPKSVYQFLKENKGKMSGLSFREGSRKLPEHLQKKLERVN